MAAEFRLIRMISSATHGHSSSYLVNNIDVVILLTSLSNDVATSYRVFYHHFMTVALR